jgi:hypothetical protein
MMPISGLLLWLCKSLNTLLRLPPASALIIHPFCSHACGL